MAYATAADMLRYYGGRTLAYLAALEDPAVDEGLLMQLVIEAGDTGGYDPATLAAATEAVAHINQVLDDEAGYMDSILVERYTVPVTGATAVLRRPNADLARCALYAANVPDDLRARCEHWRAWLQSIAAGSATLPGVDDASGYSSRYLLRVS